MPTKKPRITFAISEEELSLIETFRIDHEIKNQSQAILSLLALGIEKTKGLSDVLPPKKEQTLSPAALRVAAAYDRADERARQMVDLTLEPFMKKQEAKTG